MEVKYDDGMTERTSFGIFIRAFENLNRITNFVPTIDRGVAQLASAHVWGTWGRKFESSHPDQNKTTVAGAAVVFLFTQLVFLTFHTLQSLSLSMEKQPHKNPGQFQAHGWVFRGSVPAIFEAAGSIASVR